MSEWLSKIDERHPWLVFPAAVIVAVVAVLAIVGMINFLLYAPVWMVYTASGVIVLGWACAFVAVSRKGA